MLRESLATVSVVLQRPRGRRAVEIGFWLVVLSLSALLSATFELASAAPGASRRLVVLSALASAGLVGVLLPIMIWLHARVPIASAPWPKAVLVHLSASGLFALVYAIAVTWVGASLAPPPATDADWQDSLAQSAPAGLWTYWLIIAVLWAYRAFRDVEARKLAEQLPLELIRPDEIVATDPSGHRELFLVRELGREKTIPVRDVSWIQAAGKHVILHLGASSYRLRESMQSVERSLDPNFFLRVHRSRIVNLDRIKSIHPWFHGDYRIVMRDGAVVNYSRRYRSRLERALG